MTQLLITCIHYTAHRKPVALHNHNTESTNSIQRCQSLFSLKLLMEFPAKLLVSNL